MRGINVGCEAYILRDGKLLLGKRGRVDGEGTWGLPGGHLDFMERADEGLIRELEEETGIKVSASAIILLALTDDLRPNRNEHYLHITFKVDIGSQQPKLLEPDKCSEWAWFDPDSLPEIFPFQAKIFDTIRTGSTYAKTG
jgi:8-oxo-dGTP diphosphatase